MGTIDIEQLSALFGRVASMAGEDREQGIAEHPELFAEQYHAAILAATAGTSSAGSVADLVEELTERMRGFRTRSLDFVLGSGPYEVICSQVIEGTVSQDVAEARARAIAEPSEAGPYLKALGSLAGRLPPIAALGLLGVIRAATAVRVSGPLGDEAGRVIELRYLRAAARYLVDEADGRVFLRAAEVGASLLAHSAVREDSEFKVDVLLALGALYTDPFTARRNSRDLVSDVERWQHSFWSSHRYELPQDDSWRMPPVATTLGAGAAFFGRAADLLEGHDRGLALKAVHQTLALAEGLGGGTEPPSTAMAWRAVELIDPAQAPGDYVTLLANLDVAGESVPVERIDDLLRPSLDRVLRDCGDQEALSRALNVVQLLGRVDPSRVEAAATAARGLVELLDQEWARIQQFANELRAFVWGRVPGGYDGIPADLPVVAAVEEIASIARREEWDPTVEAAALVGLAGQSPHSDEEREGLDALDRAELLAPVWAQAHRAALAHFRGTLHLGLGVNAFQARDWRTAIEEYSAALSGMCDLNLSDAALDVLSRIDDLTFRSGKEGSVQAIIGLTPFAVTLEQLCGQPATWKIQRACRSAIANLLDTSGQVNVEALWVVLQVAKGLRFAGALLGAARVQHDTTAARLLARLHEAEARHPRHGEPPPPDPDEPLDESLVLAAHATKVSGAPTAGGDTAMDLIAGLRRAYSNRLSSLLLADSHPEDQVFLGSESIRRALDERTVLVDLYIGADIEGRMAVHTVATTTTDTIAGSAVCDGVPFNELQLGDDDHQLLADALALIVSDLRRSLLEPSDPDVLTPKSLEDLDGFVADWLPVLAARLDEWLAAGKDHLCFVPHGSLHTLPFHILHHDGRPLAEQWVVTVLPNHALLLDERGRATTTTRRPEPVTAFGLGYGDGGGFGLPPLPGATAEAAAVARVFGAAPVLDSDATERRFIDALMSSRYVHLAAHGRYDVNAPLFHCVYLTPGSVEGGGFDQVDVLGDGRLRAHEILGFDLRGTELVTLSACETSLAGVDSADNIAGLPAALFVAGVRTIVGTLWEVRSDAAERFFGVLYENLRQGLDRRDAFAAAQRRTREAFPVYRDWGAFCFLGTWN